MTDNTSNPAPGTVPETTPKIALITGGSRGLGRSTAEALLARGVDVVATFHSREDRALELVAAAEAMGRRAAVLRLDVADISAIPGFVAALREVLRSGWNRDDLDFLVNNGGTGLHRSIADTTVEEFDRMVNQHLRGVFFSTQALIPLLADGGRIVNISSGLARFSFPDTAAYAMMKGGIEVFTRSLAKELGGRGITANTVAPGAIQTEFNGAVVRDNPEVNRRVAAATALGRPGLPEDIGPMIAALLGPENGWVNAQRIEVSGGMMI